MFTEDYRTPEQKFEDSVSRTRDFLHETMNDYRQMEKELAQVNKLETQTRLRADRIEKQNHSLIKTHNELIERIQEALRILEFKSTSYKAKAHHAAVILRGPEPEQAEEGE